MSAVCCNGERADTRHRLVAAAGAAASILACSCGQASGGATPVATPTKAAVTATAGATASAAPATATPTASATATVATAAGSTSSAGATATATGVKAAACAPSAGPVAAAAFIHLNPTSGGPGTVVCITGFLPGGPDAAGAKQGQRYATACWDGCRGSLTEDVQVTWAAGHPGYFAARLTVPRTAWLTSAGPHPLAPATYRVGIQCLAPQAGGCAMRPAQATASFRLTGSAPSRCGTGQPCAALALSPDAAIPGTTVHVSGWAPLTQIIGQPMGYTLVLDQGGNPPMVGQVSQRLDGSIQGSFRLPAALNGPNGLTPLAAGRYTIALEALFNGVAGTGQPITKGAHVVGSRLLLAPTPLTISPAPTWASLGKVHPLAIQPSADLFGGAVAAVGGALAYCAPGGIEVSHDGGRTWATVPAAGIAAAAAKVGYAIPGYERKAGPTCSAVTLDPAHPASVYATYGLVTAACDCIPPAFMVGFATADAGSAWSAVPQPAAVAPNHGDLGFGGFAAQGGGVAALFGLRGAGAPTVEVSTDGGRTWAAGQLACPARGPCVRWGPAPSQVSACMTSFPQPLEVRGAGGAWSPSTQVDLCQGTSQVAALSPTELALLSARAAYPLRVSGDGGHTWTDVALPPLAPGRAGFDALVLLPDGALLAESQPPSPAWSLLPPGATTWCPISGLSSAAQSTSLTAADGRLWWLPSVHSGKAPALHSLPLSGLACP